MTREPAAAREPALAEPGEDGRWRGLLRCPHCGGALAREERVWRCADGHAFDVARQGYVNLLPGRPVHEGDTAAMLDRRGAVLAGGHLDLVTDAVVAACAGGLPPGALVEVGAGTAHHLAAVRRSLPGRVAVALDVSVAAARRAARTDPEGTIAVVADAWGAWPLRDGVAAAVLTIFAPRNPAEAARVLRAGGRLVVVTPAPDHLIELVGPLGLLALEPGKRDRMIGDVGTHLEPADTDELRTTRTLDRAAMLGLALMGPTARHADERDVAARVATLAERLDVTVAVHVTTFVKPR